MRILAKKTASQIALSNCSKEVGWEVSIYVILVKGGSAVKHTFWQKISASLVTVTASHEEPADVFVNDFSAFLDMRRCKKNGLVESSSENTYLKASSTSFPQSTECLIPDLYPELLPACVEGQ